MKILIITLLFIAVSTLNLTLVEETERMPFICPQGKYFTGQRCQSCFNDFCICSTPFGCDEVVCASNQVKINTTYHNDFINLSKDTSICVECPTGCATCESISNSKTALTCTKCQESYVMIENMCVPLSGSFYTSLSLEQWGEQVHQQFNLIIQQHIQSNIKNITSCNQYNNIYQCSQCQSRSFLNEYGFCEQCTQNCLACTQRYICQNCDYGYYWNPLTYLEDQVFNGGCSLCHQNSETLKKCKFCPGTGYSCVECYEGYYLNIIDNQDHQCEFCSGNSEKKLGCKFCRIGGFCEECFDGYYLDGDECGLCFGNSETVQTCQLCNQGRNFQCNQCFQGYQLVGSKLCVDCQKEQSDCLECDINDGNQIICKVCKNGYYLIKQADFEGKCAKCPEGMVRCYQNDGNNYQLIEPIPTQCPNKQYLVHQVVNTEKVVCTSALLDSECYIMKNDQKGCLKCYPFEKWIQNGDQCVQCQGENGIGIQGCLKCEVNENQVQCISCKTGYSLVQGICRACLIGCLKCNEKQDCFQCDIGYRKNYQVCEKCRISQCKQCDDNQDLCDECNEGYFTYDKNQCLVCPPGCSDCQHNNGQDCKKCFDGYYKQQDGCTQLRPFCGMYSDNECQICQYGYRYQDGQCLRCLDEIGAYVCGINAGLSRSQLCKMNGSSSLIVIYLLLIILIN